MKKLLLTTIGMLSMPLLFAQSLSNNPCPLPFPPGAEWPIDGSCYAANINGSFSPSFTPTGCNAGAFDDGFAWFVGDGGNVIIDYNPAAGSDPVMHVFDATAGCGALNQLGCSDNCCNGTQESVSVATTLGNIYLIRLQDWNSNANMNGTLCLTSAGGGPGPGCGGGGGTAVPGLPDNCTAAADLGTLPAPSACNGSPTEGQGATVNFCTTNIGATPENPYTYQTGCQGGADMPTFAADTWYTFTASGNEVDITINGLTTPFVGLYEQGNGCGDLLGRGCLDAVPGSGTVSGTIGPVTPGQQYWIQVSGGDINDTGDFEIILNNDNNCAICFDQGTFTATPPPNNGAYLPGQVVTFCLTVENYNHLNANWIHGVVPIMGPGWTNLAPTGDPVEISTSGTWGWWNSVTSSANPGTYSNIGPGWFYDYNTAPGNPGNNFGDSGFGPWTFCWTAQVSNTCVDGQDLSMSVETYADAETGSWTSLACVNDPVYTVNATMICCDFPTITTSTDETCAGANDGTATALGNGVAPYNYVWINASTGTTVYTDNNNPGSSTATGLAPGTYTIDITDDNGCTRTATVTILPAPTFTVTASMTPSLCAGAPCTGTVSATVAGGTPPITYSWDGGLGAGQNQTAVCAGTFTVTATDANGCQVTDAVTVTAPPILAITATATDEVCIGDCDGTVTANNATGGTPPYSYAWSGGLGAGQNVTGVCPGNYTVTVTDANNCIATANVTINPGLTVTANFNPIANQCFNGNSFNFTDNSTNATGWNWDFGDANTSTAQNPTHSYGAPGVYTVTLTASNGTCSDVYQQNVTVYPDPTSATTGTNVSCNGVCDGTASAGAGGGTPPYTYSWAPSGGTGATATGLCPGTYTVTITDANLCTTTGQYTVTEPPVLAVTATATDESCNGSCDGSVTANNATGGTPPYSYNWGGLGAGQNFTNVCAGGYTVTVTDANGCTATANVTVNTPPVLTVTAGGADASCFGVCDGDLTSNGAGGTPPYSYSWNGGVGAGQNHTGTVCAGTYTVTVTDANGCTATDNFTVNEPPVLTANAGAVDASCFGVCDGDLTSGAAGGTPPYSYSWDGGVGAGQNHTGTVCAGTYTVTVTDANGCTATASATVNEPAVMAVTATSTDASCFGVCDGTVSANLPTGGTPPYTYSWDGGLGAGSNQTGVCAGTYTVTATDANGCTATATVTVNEPPVLTVTTGSADASCFGVCDGDVTSNGAGGTPPYTYSWDGGLGAGQNHTGTVCAGTYNVTVTDANGCTATASATVNEPPVLTVTTGSADASCFGVCDGDVTSNGAGGTPPYSYSWDGGLGAGQNHTGTVCAGTYNVTVTDANGCTATASATVNEPPALAATTAATDASCFGICDGTVTANLPTGGTPPYTYNWDGGLGAGANQTGVCAGTYNVTVTDANGCTVVVPATVNEPPVLTVVMSGNDASCFGVCDGDATATPAGGTPPYSYQWDAGGGFATTATATGLCAGTAGVTITDANGCTVTDNFVINEPTQITIPTSTTDPTCGNSDGTATATPAGGTPPYTYLWDDPGTQTTATATGLAAGGYTVTVTDAAGCVETATVTLTDVGAPTATITASTDVTCFGGNDGDATVTPAGGTPPYTYLWDDGLAQTTATAVTLPAGTYTVTVTDAIGCVATASVTINEPPQLTVAVTSFTDPLCAGSCDGTADATAAGGTPPYTYSWTSGGTTANETGMCAGTETVTVTDANGCTANANVTLTDPPVLTAAIVGTDATCFGVCDGSADLTVGGGTPPYTYLWDNAATTEDISGLCAGTFNVTVTDANGCTAVAGVTINEPTQITIPTTAVDATCGASNGSATATPAGGTPGYTYLWDDLGAQTTATATGLPAGTYTVTVTDANGCIETATATVNDIGGGTASAVVDNQVTCNAACDGQATGSIVGGTPPYTYLWDDPGAQTTATATGLCAGTWTVTITDNNGCVATASVTITEPPVLTVSIPTFTDPTCAGVCDGTADAVAGGGTPPYTYSWTSGGTTANETGMCAGTHTVTVTDANGCTANANVTLTDPPVLTAAIVGTDATCFGVCDGSADLTPGGGTPPYTYLWDNAATTEDISGLCAGTYNVTVTDANGCTAVAGVTINEPTQITIPTTTVDATCGASNGSATATPAGGTPGYTYLWDDLGAQTTATATGLPAGTYTVTVTDANGCIETATATVNDLGGGTASAVVDNHVSCAGGCDGQATASMVGGTPPYTYLWDDPGAQTTATATGLCAGTWTVTITDNNGCVATASVTITEPIILTATSSTTNTSCTAVCDGTATVTPQNGTPPYTYAWTAGGAPTAATNTDLCVGNVDVTVTDANGCTVTLTVTINADPNFTVTIAGTDPLCFGGCDGSADATVVGGVAPYTYAWGHGPTAEDLTGVLCAGNYDITVTDANGCQATANVTISNPPQIVINPVVVVDAVCFGDCNGSLTTSATGGTGALSYSWTDDATSLVVSTNPSATGLCAGNYTLIVTDANGCTQMTTGTVNEPTQVTLSTSAVDANCGQADGSVSVTGSGGTVAVDYTYAWVDGGLNPVGNTATVTGLAAGTYTVTITDDVGCTATGTATINDLGGGTASTTIINQVTCFGACDGSAIVNMVGGTPPFTYLWSSGATPTAQTATGLCPGTHSVDVTDALGCIASATVTITEPAVLVVPPTAVDATCFGFSDGSVDVIVTGGTPPYTYDWVDQATSGSVGTTASVTGLPAGTYCVTVTDANGCNDNQCVTINEPADIVPTVTATDASCGQSDGSISVTGTTGGSGTYTTYDWVDDATTLSVGSTPTVNGVPAGSYTVTVTDDQGCTGTANVVVNDLLGPTGTLVSVTDASCNGACDGQATVSGSGGTGALTYLWTPGNMTGTTETGLCAGAYNVQVTDANGCVDNITVTVNEPTPVVASITGSVDPLGSGTCDGSATAAGAGGTPGYTYQWWDATYTTPYGTAATETNMCAGDYCVIVTDANGCADTVCVTLVDPAAILVPVTGTDATCPGACDGTANVVVTGGVAPYAYQWFAAGGTPVPGATNPTVTGLCAGDYYVEVTDANSILTVSELVTIAEPLPITGVTSVTSNYNGQDISCFGACDGTADVVAGGGTAPYTYDWFDDATQLSLGVVTPVVTGLCAGTYGVEITDANGCLDTFYVTLTEPTQLTAVMTKGDPSCNGICDGTTTATPSGGTPPYTYLWNDPLLQTTQTATGLCDGVYDVVITDANGCSITETITLTEPIALVLTGTSNGSTCGQPDGDATVTVVAGVPGYTILWDVNAGSQTTFTATNLTSGCYDAYVTDGNGCSDTITVCVSDLGAPVLNVLTVTDASCFGACDGFAQVQVVGGSGPFNYEWYDVLGNPLGINATSTNILCAGDYTIEVVDGTGCLATTSVTINEPTLLNPTVNTTTDVTCFGDCDGTASLIVAGGTPPYTYLWSAGSTPTLDNTGGLCPGTHSVTVTDANGCDSTITVTIGEPLELLLTTDFVDAFCGTPTGSAWVMTTNGVAPFSYLWDAAAGSQTTDTAFNLVPGTYGVTVTDVNGCSQTASVTVGDIPPSIAVIAGSTPVSCFGGADGTATSSVGGSGTPPYNYEWWNATTNSPTGQFGLAFQTGTNMPAGDYYVVVTDANGCISVSDTVTITEPPLLTVNITPTDANCKGVCDGSALAVPAGGTPPYTYQWNDPLNQITDQANFLCVGSYDVTVTDNNGCTVVGTAVINEPPQLVLDSTVVNANCGQADGSGCVLASGGTPPYTYQWPASAGSSTNSCVVNIPAGTYLVTVTDANLCSEIIGVEVSDIAGPAATIVDSGMVACFNGNNGYAIVDMIGGQGWFTAQWDANTGNQTGPSATNLAAGTYSVTITDSVGCSASTSVVITQPNQLTFIQNQIDPTCSASCDGEMWVSVIGGTQPYTYSWTDNGGNPMGTNDTLSNVCAGTYTLAVIDDNGCTINLNYTLTDPPAVTATTSVSDVNCFGACDGTATANGGVGVPPFTYQWDAAAGNQATQTAIGLCPGTYTCTVTDADGCNIDVTATVVEPTALVLTQGPITNVSCSGACDGIAEVIPSGGTPNYTYVWSGGVSTGPTASGLCAGTYTVDVTDAQGCSETITITITDPQALALVVNTQDVTCYNACDGQVQAVVTGGTAPFSYLWTTIPGFPTTSTVNGVCAGTHTVDVTDANGCTISQTVVITQPTILSLTTTVTDANCGQNNGNICVNVVGGVAPYTYQWNSPNGSTTACSDSVTAGCYTVVITDANGCFFDSTICVNDIAGPTLTVTNVGNVSCNAGSDGFIDISVVAGVPPYSIIWEDGAGNVMAAFTDQLSAVNLPADVYTITVTDAAGCVASTAQQVTEPTLLTSTITNVIDVSCNLGSDGSATVLVLGGTPPYTYSWNGGANPTSDVNTGLAAGTYVVNVTDSLGCTTSSTVTINEPAQLVVVVDSVNDASCNAFCDGNAYLSVTGGTAPYNYIWTPNVSNGPSAFNLCAGTYDVMVVDANNCQATVIVTISEPAALALTPNAIPSTCSQANGIGAVTVTGGTAPYSWLWPDATTNPTNNALLAGTHNVLVTDANGCTANVDVVITDQPAPVIDSMTFTSPTCNGVANGSATVYASGGTGAYTYLWNDPAMQVSQTAIALTAGNYCVTVTDINGCQVTQCINVTEPAPLQGVPSQPLTICYGDSTQIYANAQGGTPPYTYTWQNLPFSGTGPIVVAPTQTTTYCFSVTDANNCFIADACVTITVTPALQLDLSPDQFICDGETITLTANASGGNGDPYIFTWTEGAANGPVLPGNTAGSTSTIDVSPTVDTWYYVLLDDGCSTPVLDSVLVSLNPNPVVFLNVVDSAGCEDFLAQFTANSDIGVFYEWDFECDGIIDQSGNNLTSPTHLYTTPGTYDVCLTVTSADGCVTSITEPAIVEVYPTPVAGFTADPMQTTVLNPTINFTNTSVGGLIYTWDFGDGDTLSGPDGDVPAGMHDGHTIGTYMNPSHTYTDSGYYDITLTVTNAYGCSDSHTITVYVEGDYILFAPNAFTPNGDGKNDFFFPVGVGIDESNFDFFVFDRWGELIFESHHPDNWWDGNVKGTGVMAKVDVYVWMVRAQDYQGNEHTYYGHVTVVR